MKVFNSPGRYDRSPDSLQHVIHRETTQPGVRTGFVTEVQDKDRAAAVAKGAGAGFTVTHFDRGPGTGECAILTNEKLGKIIHTALLQLTDGDGKRRLSNPLYAPVVIDRAKTSRRVTLFSNAHLPAHMEDEWRKLDDRTKARILLREQDTPPVIREYLEAVVTWKRKVRHLAADYHVDDIVLGPDWNLDGDAAWIHVLIDNIWPDALHMAVTDAADLGRRNVGWLLTTMNLEDSEVRATPASDHRVGRFTLSHINRVPSTDRLPKRPDPFERCTYNGARMDQKTKTAVQLGEKRLGYSLTIEQGCYSNSVGASAGTHGGGQVIDFSPFEHARKVRVFRDMGWFIWHRPTLPGVWNEHIHGGIRNGGRLSPEAARQQDDYDAHPPRNGLADHAIDNTYHPKPPATFDYADAWRKVAA